MGIIKSQSIYQSIISYIGILIGTISTLFVYPYLDMKQNGDIQFVISTATLLVPFWGLGLPAVAVYFFPYFNTTKSHKGQFLSLLLFFTFISSSIFSILIYLSKEYFSKILIDSNSYLFGQYIVYILLISYLSTFITLFQSYMANFNKTVVPNAIYNLSLKILQPIIIILYLTQLISYITIFNILTGVYVLILIAIIYYLHSLKTLTWQSPLSILPPQITSRSIIHYSLFSILINMSSILALQIDKILVGTMINTSLLAVFNIPVMITEAIDVPRKAISGIAAPIISSNLKSNNIDNVDIIYKKSALLQFIVGSFLLIGVWVCSDDLYSIMPKGNIFAEGKSLILILGGARLIDMLTGVNTEIIAFSKYYRVNLIMLIILSCFNISLNYILIPQYGIVGAAYATLISMFLFNAIKLVFIYSKMSIHPFSKNMLGAFLIGSVIFVMANNIPAITINNWGIIPLSIFRIALKGLLITSVYFLLIWKFNISQDINSIIQGVFLKVKGWVKTS